MLKLEIQWNKSRMEYYYMNICHAPHLKIAQSASQWQQYSAALCFQAELLRSSFMWLEWATCFTQLILNIISTLSSFKAKPKTFLFSQYFHPN